MRKRAKILLKNLDDQKELIVVPTVAISEFLCGIPSENHGAVVAEFQGRFVCPPFDFLIWA
jgi:hypothetical protein